MLALRSALKYILPEIPEWLAAEIARAEHCRREMQCKGTSPRATPPSPHSSTSLSQLSHEHEQNTPDMYDKNEHIRRYDMKMFIFASLLFLDLVTFARGEMIYLHIYFI